MRHHDACRSKAKILMKLITICIINREAIDARVPTYFIVFHKCLRTSHTHVHTNICTHISLWYCRGKSIRRPARNTAEGMYIILRVCVWEGIRTTSEVK